MLLSQTEENYLKAIYTLTEKSQHAATSTTDIAERINTKPPTVTDMLKKLAAKKLVTYEKYKKIQLTKFGRQWAIQVIRKHRLWEVFLHEKLRFTWDEVHEVAEQLEHVQSDQLTERLDEFLGYPRYDPHGDPIPTASGELKAAKRLMLSEIPIGTICQVVGVNDSSSDYLKYLEHLNIGIGTKIKLIEQIAYDASLIISFRKDAKTTVTKKFADNLFVTI